MPVAAGDQDQALIALALERDEASVRALIDRLTPVIQARVARALLFGRPSGGRPIREMVEDLTQESLLLLFANDGKVLRRWDPAHGLSLENYAGLVARRRALSLLRTGRHSPWKEDPTLTDELDGPSSVPDPERATLSRGELGLLLTRLEEELSPLGWRLFELLFIRDLAVHEVEQATSMSAAAIYAWRSRLRKLAHRLRRTTRSENDGKARIHIMDGTQ